MNIPESGRYLSQKEIAKMRGDIHADDAPYFERILADLEACRSERDQLLDLVNGVGEIHNRAVGTLREDLRGAWDKVSDFIGHRGKA